ncbi:acyl-coenzyme A thioesterase 13-like [Musca vetustissima]|uniref:acyl-coenzyme A thioesterase 13-like n=1 Tax=Musca vetustissima TaxID=27455 RepID=UPI002AB62764|nr:acyl-coenzyme A thioesterase 13-like [Musca vetustissima]XP_061389309.1 acyl-coenzyme A thioesterase 13-like [Musca vetustissima]
MSAKRGVEFLKSIAEYYGKAGGHDSLTNVFKVTGGGDGRCIGEFRVAKSHLNAAGTLHGGFIATIVDHVTSYALMSADSHPGTSVDLRVSYMSPAKENDDVIVDAKTLKVGKSMAFIDCVLKRKSDGSIIAQGGQTKYVNFKK